MKINSSIVAAALGLAFVSQVSAQTQYVYLTGSTAARDAVYNTLMAGAGFDNANVSFVGYGSSTAGNCSYMEFSNTVSGTPTIVKADWSGSEAGITDVSGSTLEYFLLDAGSGSVSPFAGTGTANAVATATAPSAPNAAYYLQSAVDVAQADNALLYSKTPGSTASQLFDNLAIPFVFVKNNTTVNGQAGLVNITADNFKNLAQGGDKLALFTGVEQPVGTTNYVYLAGRDNNSGTRVNTLGISGWGIAHAAKQITLSGATPNAITAYSVSAGQKSGGTLANSLTDSTTSADTAHPKNSSGGFIAVAYLGLADDATAEAAPINAVRLTYDGVAYTPAAVESGSYTMWGKEYTMLKAGEGTLATGFANALVANIGANTTGYEIPYSLMNVDRSGPTIYPTHN